ncbi:twin-arginine translocation pathway signal protein [Atopomonas sediminilitoris]|uniref:twin-arginine translocation pathway signal protein n=1 Tax=Atopomonas sediminilitoris TaxID=2919919 RepID=UPI001F4E1A6E|nr:twin-arginine translocation pathway signal protein [Atopomonas sediminilitoris]MCJ8170479.1 twin-arginine translocation pathway signal protein [Atopomonas sediminilitoris]
MNASNNHNLALAVSRRGLLKFSLMGSAMLAAAGVTASLSGCSSSQPDTGYQVLRREDVSFLSALIPVVMQGTFVAGKEATATQLTLQAFDRNLAHFSPEVLKLMQQLLDVLGMAFTRGPLTGVWGSWDSASREEVTAFLERWKNSSISLLNMGYSSLVQLIPMAWYGQTEAWGHCGYPGPPTI